MHCTLFKIISILFELWTMEIIDTHCHLYLADFTDDIDGILQRAGTEGITKFFLPAVDSETTEQLISLEKRFPGQCNAMMGLHPCSVKENYLEELKLVKNWLSQRKFAAIGEIGLDFYWDKSFTNQQIAAFEQQIDWAKDYQLPIVIHSREAMQQCIDIVRKKQDGHLKGIFHCFSGTESEAREIIELGFYLGIGGVITYKKAGLAELLEKIDLSALVLETDAPYLTPVPFRGKRNESSYLKYIAAKLAEVKQISVEEVARVTTENAGKVFVVE